MSLQRTTDQERAEKAWENVSEIKKKADQNLEKKYSTVARKFPVMILTNGLGQALAFLRSKIPQKPEERKKSEHLFLYTHISDWTVSQLPELAALPGSLLEKIIATDSNHYRRATTETLAFAGWLKRWAEAELKEGE